MTKSEVLAGRADRRRALLTAALGFALLESRPEPPAIAALKSWLHTWTGIGLVAAGMARQGFDLQLTRYDEQGWRATFYASGMEHSATGAIGSAWEQTPWRATQRAGWEALTKEDAR